MDVLLYVAALPPKSPAIRSAPIASTPLVSTPIAKETRALTQETPTSILRPQKRTSLLVNFNNLNPSQFELDPQFTLENLITGADQDKRKSIQGMNNASLLNDFSSTRRR